MQGDAFLTDKAGTPLEGWNPYHFEKDIVGSMRHFRIGGTDVYTVVLANGEIFLLSRRAKIYKGFPLKLNLNTESDYHLRIGSNFKSSHWTLLTENGTLFQVNLKGEILHKKQLYKPATDTQFTLINDSKNKKYVIAKATKTKITLVNDQDEIYFEKNHPLDKKVRVQLFSNGNQGDYIVLNPIEDGYMRLFDLKGNLLTLAPRSQAHIPSRCHNRGKSTPARNLFDR